MSKTKWYTKPIYVLISLALMLSLGIAAVPMAGTVEAATINVPGDYPTIKQAVDNATAGDTINVAAGTYTENISLKDGVEILGAGADVTTIDGGGSDSVVKGFGVGSTTKLDGFTITNGSASNGGGIYLWNSSPVISNCIFEGNSATHGGGGGMYNWNNSSPTVTDCTFSGNSAGENGGGMDNYRNSSPAVTNCIFEGNSAGENGGGMYNWGDSSPTVTNCTFSGNSAGENGGGMYNDRNSSPMVTNCIFSGNSATDVYGYGGGMANNSHSSPTVTNCIFSGNSATTHGGGMRNVVSSPNVTNCIFSGNSARWYGGGMLNNAASPTVTNCIFSGNSGDKGGGMYNFWAESSPTVTNCIFWGNGQEIDNLGGPTPVFTYCAIQGGYSGVGNIDADPMFVNPTAHDFHSKPGSPCIDAGTNVGAPTEDIEGNHRPIDGDGDGIATTDMGAYEYVPPTPQPHFRYLHSTSGWFNLTDPVGTQWHELWPFFCKEYHLSSWNDTSGDGVLSYCDRIDMYQKPDGEVKWYHVEEVTITLNVTHNETGGPMYIELEGGYNASVLTAPNSTQWHEIRPNFCRQYELIGWNDTSNITGELDYCDYIELTDKWTGEETWWHVEEVAIDIIVTIEPPPVGGEAYPVNKVSVLAPWIALAVLLAGGISWYALKRRRAQS